MNNIFRGSFLWLSLSTAILATACLPVGPATPIDDSGEVGEVKAALAVVTWDASEYEVISSGKGESTLSSFYGQNGAAYCLDNQPLSESCKGTNVFEGGDLLEDEPVVIRGFQLNFAKRSFDNNTDHQAVMVSGAWVTTAEMEFDKGTGATRLFNVIKSTVHSGTCNLDDVASDASGRTVGYRNDSKLLTGLYVADEFDFTSPNIYTDGNIRAARVTFGWLLGSLVQEAACTPFCWNFSPTSISDANADFGAASFTSSNTTNVMVSNYFGVTASSGVTNWNKRVMTGFCLRGHKTLSNGTQRSILHHVRARINRPSIALD